MSDAIDHAIQWLVAVLSAATLAISGAIVKLWRHEERIKALESLQHDQTDSLTALARKIDSNHEALTDRLAGATENIRADLRIITLRCLTFPHSEENK